MSIGLIVTRIPLWSKTMEEKIFSMLDVLAEKLNTTVEHLWAVLVNQAPIEGVSYLLVTGIAFIVGVCSLRFACKLFDRADFDNGNNEVISFVISLVIGVICVIGSIATFFSEFLNIAGAFFNPEYWALERLGELFVK